MRSFPVSDDLVALIWKWAHPKPFEQLTFDDALRRVISEIKEVKASRNSGKPTTIASTKENDDPLAELDALLEPQRQRAPKVDLRELVKKGLLEDGEDLYLIDYQGRRVGNEKATVSGSKLKYKGKTYSMSPLAGQLLSKAGFRDTQYRGPMFWARADGQSVLTLHLNCHRRHQANEATAQA